MEITIMTQPSISKSEDKEKLMIEITDDDHKWIERIGKTAYEICNSQTRDRTKLNEQNSGLIIESNDAAVLGCLGWVIEQNVNDIPTNLKPTFQQILDDVKARKENLERS
jgi:hypothetical protein